jgi:hypothetical protein
LFGKIPIGVVISRKPMDQGVFLIRSTFTFSNNRNEIAAFSSTDSKNLRAPDGVEPVLPTPVRGPIINWNNSKVVEFNLAGVHFELGGYGR